MESNDRIEKALDSALALSTKNSPPKLSEALRYAVFPGGGRIRPRLSLAVADAYEQRISDVALAAATAVEFLHCASLVHDDLPCFDDASWRRGKPSVHAVYGEGMAVLVGDGLIVAAFEALGRVASKNPTKMAALFPVLAQAAGTSSGLVAGQAWESEPLVNTVRYHRAKTAALFEAAAVGGAIAAGEEVAPWRKVGRLIGEAYQTADDILDRVGDAQLAGKPVGNDDWLERPSIAADMSLARALERLDRLIQIAKRAVPHCPGRDDLALLLEALGTRLCPPQLRQTAGNNTGAIRLEWNKPTTQRPEPIQPMLSPQSA